jgi:hypothetical protein
MAGRPARGGVAPVERTHAYFGVFMPIDQAQQQKFNEWIAQKKLVLACPVCGGKDFQFGEVVSAPAHQPGAGLAIGGVQVPTLQVICSGCVHVLLFAAVPMGLVQ